MNRAEQSYPARFAAPDWAPVLVRWNADFWQEEARRINQPEDSQILARLATDPRMQSVWEQLGPRNGYPVMLTKDMLACWEYPESPIPDGGRQLALFEVFLRTWGLARWERSKGRQHFCRLIAGVLRRHFNCPRLPAWEIATLTNVALGLSPRRQVSPAEVREMIREVAA